MEHQYFLAYPIKNFYFEPFLLNNCHCKGRLQVHLYSKNLLRIRFHSSSLGWGIPLLYFSFHLVVVWYLPCYLGFIFQFINRVVLLRELRYTMVLVCLPRQMPIKVVEFSKITFAYLPGQNTDCSSYSCCCYISYSFLQNSRV